MKKNARNGIIGIIILLLFITIFILSIVYQENIKSLISKEMLVYGIITLSIISFFLDFIPQYITPHLLIIQSKLLGLPTALTFSLIITGAFLGSIAGFEIGKKYGMGMVEKMYNKKNAKKIKQKIKKYGKWVIALAAISPLPYIPIIFGSMGIDREEFWKYGITMRMIGMIIFALFVGFF